MKYYCFALIFNLLSLNSFSQVQWSLFAGPQASSAHYVISDKKQSTEMKFGFQLGGGLDVQWENRLYFSPQVFYSMKGYKVKLTRSSFPPDSLAIDNDVTMHSFEFATLLHYNFSDNPSHFFMRLGPSIDVQLYGKEQFNKSNGESVNRKMKFSYGDYGHFGANIIVHAGYESAGGLMVYGQYGLGIGSIVNTDSGPIVTHRVAGITIGYHFKRKNIIIDTRNRE
ncbi:MAG: PorT family protein [Chitinophagaceae bacterium]|nr:PorT family protein [Chitinophagaceae bacterium]